MWFQQCWWYCFFSFLNFGCVFYGPPGSREIDLKNFCLVIESLSTSDSNVFAIIDKQKQPPEMFYEKRCSQKFYKIHSKKIVPESLF